MAGLRFAAAEGVQDRNLIENGRWVHIRALPKAGEDEGEPLYLKKPDGSMDETKPFRMLVRSARSTHFKNKNLHYQTANQSKISRAPSKDRDKMVVSAVADERPHHFSWLVAAIENMDAATPHLVPTEVELFETANDSEYGFIVDQVMRAAYEDAEYGIEAPKAGEGPAAAENAAPARPKQSETSKETLSVS